MSYPELSASHLLRALARVGGGSPERHQLGPLLDPSAAESGNRAVQAQLNQFLQAIVQPIMVFDGAALDAHLYPQPGIRPLEDIHLFVPPAELASTISVLRGLGYQSRAQHAHRIRFQSPNHPADLLLHWSFGWDIPWEPVLARARVLPFGDFVGLVPQVDDLLLLRMLALRREGWRAPLLHFWDLAVCLSHGAATQGSSFFSRAQAWGLHPLLPLLGDAVELFGLPHPFGGTLSEEIREEAKRRILHFPQQARRLPFGTAARFERWLAIGDTRPWSFWALILEAWVLLLLLEIVLPRLGYLRLKRWFALEVDRAPAKGRRTLVVEALLSAGRVHPCQPQCLARAIALCLMFRRRGLGGRVRLGASQRQQQFRAHAWLEIERERLDVGESFWDFQPFGDGRK